MTVAVEAESDGFKCAPVFKMLNAVLETDGATLVKQINGIYAFKVTENNARTNSSAVLAPG